MPISDEAKEACELNILADKDEQGNYLTNFYGTLFSSMMIEIIGAITIKLWSEIFSRCLKSC